MSHFAKTWEGNLSVNTDTILPVLKTSRDNEVLLRLLGTSRHPLE